MSAKEFEQTRRVGGRHDVAGGCKADTSPLTSSPVWIPESVRVHVAEAPSADSVGTVHTRTVPSYEPVMSWSSPSVSTRRLREGRGCRVCRVDPSQGYGSGHNRCYGWLLITPHNTSQHLITLITHPTGCYDSEHNNLITAVMCPTDFSFGATPRVSRRSPVNSIFFRKL